MKITDEKVTAIIAGRQRPVQRRCRPLQCEVAVKVLSDEEIDNCKLEAQRYCKNIRADLDVDPEFLERERMRQIIWRSFFDPDSEEPFFPTDKDVRKLDSVLVQSLWRVYMDVHEEMDVTLGLDEKQVDELVEELGKGQGVQEVLMHCEPGTLRLFVRSLASRLRGS